MKNITVSEHEEISVENIYVLDIELIQTIQISEILNIGNIFSKFMKNITVSEHEEISVENIYVYVFNWDFLVFTDRDTFHEFTEYISYI